MIRLALAVVAVVVSVTAIHAQSGRYPHLHDVTGVAADDVLNIRAAPDAVSAIIGMLRHDQTDIEVVSTDPSNKWGLINTGETSGWAALAYLRPQPGGDYALTRTLHCFGTEPFWSLEIIQGQSATFSTPEGVTPLDSAGLLTVALNRADRFFVGLGAGEIVIVRRALCSDDMTDRAYGLDVDYLTAGPMFSGPTLLSGCCSIGPG